MLNNKNVGRRLLLAGGMAALAGGAQAQGLGNSPYSRLGIGEYYPNTGGVRQAGMGGVGLAAPNAINVNELNPALLYYTARTTFEAAYDGQYKTVKNNAASSPSGSATLGYLSLAVPLKRRWAAAVGLKPLSAVDYETNVRSTIVGSPRDSALTRYAGSGGISRAYLAQGVHVARDLNVGFTAAYVFGTVDETTGTRIVLADGSASQTTQDRRHVHYSDFDFRAGLHYRHNLGKDLRMNLAGVYSFPANLGARRTTTQERQDVNGATVAGTTVQTEDVNGTVKVPALAQLGISVDNDKNWSASVDVAQQQWSKFSSFGTVTTPLHNTVRIGVGGEFTPDPGSVEHYFQRVNYRLGLNVAQLPYQPGGKTLYDRSVSWGFGFPLPTSSPLEATTFSLAFTYGMRGNTDLLTAGNGASNVQENYVKMTFGVTLNNRWFIKRRLQ
ncbi:MAG: hypothetical protein ACRYFR_19905 [Janthinobacterium lividum]